MTKQTLDVPKKPTDMAAFWPADGRKEVKKTDGVYIQYRDIQIGPFPNRTEASWYDGQLQEVIMGWIDKSRFAGRIFPFGDVWYVERWETNDGPFISLAAAWDHRQELYISYREAIERHWDNSGGYPADIERQKKWTKVPAEGTEGKVLIRDKKPKKTTDDIVDVSGESSIRKFIEEAHLSGATDDPTSNYRGYAVNDTTGVVHVDPATDKLHRDDHICNQECRDLAARAQAEYREDIKRTGGYLDKPKRTTDDLIDVIPDDKPLYHGDVPVIMGILMDRLGITRFEFSYDEILAFKGKVILDQSDSSKPIYMMVRQGK